MSTIPPPRRGDKDTAFLTLLQSSPQNRSQASIHRYPYRTHRMRFYWTPIGGSRRGGGAGACARWPVLSGAVGRVRGDGCRRTSEPGKAAGWWRTSILLLGRHQPCRFRRRRQRRFPIRSGMTEITADADRRDGHRRSRRSRAARSGRWGRWPWRRSPRSCGRPAGSDGCHPPDRGLPGR